MKNSLLSWKIGGLIAASCLLSTAVNAKNFALYVSDGSENSVDVVDVREGAVAQEVSVGTDPWGVVLSGQGTQSVYVANHGSGSVSVIDPIRFADIKDISVGGSAAFLNVGGTSLYVTQGATMSVIDLTTNAVDRTISSVAGHNLYGVDHTFSAGLTGLYAANFAGTTVDVFDADGDSETLSKAIPGFNAPYGVACGGTLIFVSNSGANTVSVVDTAIDEIRNNVVVGATPRGIVVGPSGVYVANGGSGTVSMIDLGGTAALRSIAVGNNPYALALDGTALYVGNSNDDSISVIDTAKNSVVATWNDIPNQKGLVAAPSWGMYISSKVGVDGTGVQRPIFVYDFLQEEVLGSVTAINPAQMAYSGTGLYVVNENNRTVQVVDLTKNVVAATAIVGNNPLGIAVAGGTVYVVANGDSNVIPISPATNVPDDAIAIGGPISQLAALGGTTLYVSSGTSTVPALFLVDIDVASVADFLDLGAGQPTYLAPAGTALLVTSPSNNRVYSVAVSALNFGFVETITGVQQPRQIASSGTAAYVANYSDSSVSVISSDKKRVVKTLDSNVYPFAVAVGGSTIFVDSITGASGGNVYKPNSVNFVENADLGATGFDGAFGVKLPYYMTMAPVLGPLTQMNQGAQGGVSVYVVNPDDEVPSVYYMEYNLPEGEPQYAEIPSSEGNSPLMGNLAQNTPVTIYLWTNSSGTAQDGPYTLDLLTSSVSTSDYPAVYMQVSDVANDAALITLLPSP